MKKYRIVLGIIMSSAKIYGMYDIEKFETIKKCNQVLYSKKIEYTGKLKQNDIIYDVSIAKVYNFQLRTISYLGALSPTGDWFDTEILQDTHYIKSLWQQLQDAYMIQKLNGQQS